KATIRGGISLKEFIDLIRFPIVVVDDDAFIQTANAAASVFTGRALPDIAPKRGGDVFQCAYAQLPGGCGKTKHCSGCAIRRSVLQTFETGIACRNVPAQLMPSDKKQAIDLLITTERVGNTVLLRIDEVNGIAAVQELAAS
ncbi:MAG TPA: hypothetical protein VGL77_09945, partial [Armatimonadota bacterium]